MSWRPIGIVGGGQIEGSFIIDVTDSEALLVRKDGDGGNVFVADTVNNVVAIGGSFCYGDFFTNNTWKTVKDGTKLSFQRRESGSYVEKGFFDSSFHAPELHSEDLGGVAGSVCLHEGTSPLADSTGERLWTDSNGDLFLLLKNATPTTKVQNKIIKADASGDVAIVNNNPTLKLEDDGGNYALVRAGNSQLTLEIDPDDAVDSSDIVFKVDGDEVARFDPGGSFGVGLIPSANMAGLSIEAGVITVKETATPTADSGYGKIYTKDDNTLYFQDGAGVEHGVSSLEWAIQGALDNVDIGTSNYTVPLSSLITGYDTTLQETDVEGWRSGTTLTVLAGKAGWYNVSFGVDHPSDSFGESSTQEAIADFRVGMQINTRVQFFAEASASGRPDSGSFSLPVYLNAGDTVRFILNAGTAQGNEDWLIRASIIRL